MEHSAPANPVETLSREAALRHVLAPLEVGRLVFRNRILVPGHTTNYGDRHLPSERHLEYHRARARGGAAAIIFEGIRVHPNCLGRPQGVAGFMPEALEPFRRIADAVHAEGALMLGQVIHLGRQIDGDFERTVSWGPSPIRWTATAQVPHAMTAAEMQEVVDAHVLTARNLLAAGFDGFELQVAHGHLLQQFLSPSSNQRSDEFGGSEEARLRFPLSVIRAVRAAVGPDACMGLRISAEEFIADGLHLDEMCRQLLRIVDAVAIDFVNVSHSAYQGSFSLATQMADMGFGRVPFRHLPAAVRSALRAAGHTIPVFAVCRFRTLQEAGALLAEGGADAIGMARGHLAEPALVRKWQAGRDDEIRPCIGCNQGCAGMLEKNIPITCLVNPRAGREGAWPEPEEDRAAEPGDVVVIGGGPAGLEAAWVAAARGHRVQLFERASELGGQLTWIRHMPARAEFLDLLRYQVAQCRRFGVEIHTGHELDATAVAALAPDAIVLATGSAPDPFAIAGNGTILSITDALRRPELLRGRVAIFDQTGEWSAVGMMEHVAALAERLTVFSPVGAFGWRTTIYSTLATWQRLREHKVERALLRRVHAFENGALLVEDLSTGEMMSRPGFDVLIVTQYNRATDRLAADLVARGLAPRLVGDCAAPRTALEAVFEGHAAGRAVLRTKTH